VAWAERASAILAALESLMAGPGTEERRTAPGIADEPPRDLLLSASEQAETARQKADTLAERLAEQRRQTAALQEQAKYQRNLARAADEDRRAATETAEAQQARVAEFDAAARRAAVSDQELSRLSESAEREARAAEAVAGLDRGQAAERRVPEAGEATRVAGVTPAPGPGPTAGGPGGTAVSGPGPTADASGAGGTPASGPESTASGAEDAEAGSSEAVVEDTRTTTKRGRSGKGRASKNTGRRDSAPPKQDGENR
jgi:septal ring factor EnvC (AmiA/AmiB activator)